VVAVLPAVDLATVDDRTDVDPVLEEIGERAHPEPHAPDDSPVGASPLLRPDAAPIEVFNESADRAKLDIAGKDCADGLGVLGHHHEFLVDAGIAGIQVSQGRVLRTSLWSAIFDVRGGKRATGSRVARDWFVSHKRPLR